MSKEEWLEQYKARQKQEAEEARKEQQRLQALRQAEEEKKKEAARKSRSRNALPKQTDDDSVPKIPPKPTTTKPSRPDEPGEWTLTHLEQGWDEEDRQVWDVLRLCMIQPDQPETWRKLGRAIELYFEMSAAAPSGGSAPRNPRSDPLASFDAQGLQVVVEVLLIAQSRESETMLRDIWSRSLAQQDATAVEVLLRSLLADLRQEFARSVRKSLWQQLAVERTVVARDLGGEKDLPSGSPQPEMGQRGPRNQRGPEWLIGAIRRAVGPRLSEVGLELFEAFAGAEPGPIRQAVLEFLLQPEEAYAPWVVQGIDRLPAAERKRVWQILHTLSVRHWQTFWTESAGVDRMDWASVEPIEREQFALWRAVQESPDRIATIVDHVKQLATLDQSPEILLTAWTVPTMEVRRQWAELIESRWRDGPNCMERVIREAAMIDPAMLPMLKTLLRKRPLRKWAEEMAPSAHVLRETASRTVTTLPAEQKSQSEQTGFAPPRTLEQTGFAPPRTLGESGGERIAKTPSPAGQGGRAILGPQVLREQGAVQSWVDALYWTMDQTMQLAAQGTNPKNQSDQEVESILGFRLHKRGCPLTTRLLVLTTRQPEGRNELSKVPATDLARSTNHSATASVSSAVASADSTSQTETFPVLRISYCRVLDWARANSTVGYYRRITPQAVERPTGQGVWLEGVSQEGDRLVSVDVRIRPARGALLQNPREEADLEIEILRVEVPWYSENTTSPKSASQSSVP